MIIRRYLVWATTATASQRAAAADALVRAYSQSPLSASERTDIDTALAGLATDESPLVRRALAEAFSRTGAVPPAILSTLLADGSGAVLPLLETSSAISADQLVDCAALGNHAAQLAIAARPELAASVAAALAEVASLEILLELVANRTAAITQSALIRMLDRYGDSIALQTALLERADLPSFVRHALVSLVGQRMVVFSVERGWLSRARGEALQIDADDISAMVLIAKASDATLARLVNHLIASRQLTVGLLLRSLLCGEPRLMALALAELTGDQLEHVEMAFTGEREAFAALYRKAGLPQSLLGAFEAALKALNDLSVAQEGAADGRLSRELVLQVIDACEAMPAADAGPLLARLERFLEEAPVAPRHVDGPQPVGLAPTEPPAAVITRLAAQALAA